MLWKGFQRPKRLEFDPDSITPVYGKFVVQPLERGFGTTVGNALRRVLLSSIEGAGLTAVRIEGVLHEFSSLPGVVEDTTDIILNMKRVPILLHTDESDEQTRKVLRRLGAKYGNPTKARDETRPEVLKHWAMQRMLQCHLVAIPFAEYVAERLSASNVEIRDVSSW